jgi:hypothetical protein
MIIAGASAHKILFWGLGAPVYHHKSSTPERRCFFVAKMLNTVITYTCLDDCDKFILGVIIIVEVITA